jgi:membrane fusion protein, copper/silver efflux system
MNRVFAVAALMTLVLGASVSHMQADQSPAAKTDRPSEASDAVKAIVTSYLQIHAQLAVDKIDGIKAPSAAIATRAKAMGKDGEALVKTAEAMGAATDVPKGREAFGALSDAVIAVARAEGLKNLGDVKLVFCPMLSKSWLQKGDEIRNPYFGPRMSTCGEIKS